MCTISRNETQIFLLDHKEVGKILSLILWNDKLIKVLNAKFQALNLFIAPAMGRQLGNHENNHSKSN